jgi:hypothetical protein
MARKTRIVRLAGAAHAGRRDDFTNVFGKDLAFHRILTGFAVFDVGPFTVSGHFLFASCVALPLPNREGSGVETGLLSCFFFLAYANTQFTQLLGIDRRGSVGHQALGGLGLREGNHITDAGGAGHEHDQTIQTKSKAAVRRRAVLESIQQEAEFSLASSSEMPSALNTAFCISIL